MERKALGVALLTAVVMSSGVSAADVQQGEALAQQWCSNCHIVAPEQAAGGDAAPAFTTIAETAADRTNDLRAWLADPHPPMPNLDLTRNEIEDLLAYIESLAAK
ncbi:MAG: c-type cytochrome [Geminicoccaceae bacterium]